MKKRPNWQWAAIAGAVALTGFVGYRLYGARSQDSQAKSKKGGGAVPVATAAARSGEIPVFLEGLGSVNAFYTVTVHTRVDGQLMSVAFKEGQYVKAGDLLAQIDPRPFQAQLGQAEGQFAKDSSLLANAKLDLERYKDLLAQQAIPQQQYDTQLAVVGQYEGMTKNDQALVDAAKLNLTYSRITAPIGGRVGLRQVDPGNIVRANDQNGIIVITQLQPIAVVFTLPEDSLPSVLQRMKNNTKLPVIAFNRDKSQQLASGVLETVDNEIDPNTGTSKLKAVFDNKDNMLFPNQFVNVRLLLETRKNQVIIPSVAIQRGRQGTFVYVVNKDKDNTVESRDVVAGATEGTDSSIDKGLQAGDVVVIDGAESLKPGSKISTGTGSGEGSEGAESAGSSKESGKSGHRSKKGK